MISHLARLARRLSPNGRPYVVLDKRVCSHVEKPASEENPLSTVPLYAICVDCARATGELAEVSYDA